MKLSSRFTTAYADRITLLKAPGVDAPPAQRDPEVMETVSRMLSDIERHGLDAIRRYASTLDGQPDGAVELDAAQVAGSGDRLPKALREAIELGAERTQRFAALQRAHLTDFEEAT
ncbi:histidinol dehydrogenase, partial [Streptomyces sp. NPDC057757]|uniref:histidinol dehydrogenase n=1 Tax=Streptomyces sp. NPDC057757 TaxID=3346241 RepID=UPI0036C8E954